jgi:regulator of protease activity HflC (stomatin/prohibitin superfamily)
METHNLKGGLWNLLISLAAALGAVMLVVALGGGTAWALLIFLAVGVLVAVVSWLHMHLANREGLEQLELEEVSQGRGAEALFAEGEVLPAKRSREQFEKWVVPLVAVGIFLLQAWGLYHLGLKKLPGLLGTIEANQETVAADRLRQFSALIVTALLGLILFLRGQFASNYSRLEKQRLLQPASDYVLFGAYLNFAMAAMVAVRFKFAAIDYYVAVALTILLGMMALENLLSMIFEIYRPRMAGRRARLLYQSRLVGLIAKPENLFTTVGKVLNYQFGFKVSETWGYQFLRKRLWVLFGVQVILLWLSTSIVVIQPSEVGMQTGVLGGSKLPPGFHLKLPWPFAQVDRFYPGQVHSFIVGLEPLDEPGRPKLWTDSSGVDYKNLQASGELYFMAGSSATRTSTTNQAGNVLADILVASIPVHYRIKRDGLESGWLQFHKQGERSDAERLVESIAYREIVAFFLETNLAELLQAQGSEANRRVKAAIQKEVDGRGLGVEILFVGLGNIRPPAESPRTIKPELAKEGEDNPPTPGSESGLERTTMAVAVELESANRVEATNALNNALEFEAAEIKSMQVQVQQEASRAQVEVDLADRRAQAERDRLEGEAKPYHAAPRVYRQWRYLESFRKAVEHARKYVIAVGQDVEVEVEIDLQESLRREMYEIKQK